MTKRLYDFAHMHEPSLFASEDMSDGVQRKLDALSVIHLAALAKVKQIKTSKELTIKGQQSAIADLQVDVEKQLVGWQKANHHYADFATQLEGKMRPKHARPDDVVRFLKEQEIRQQLSGMDNLEIQVMYMEAVESGNDLFADAIEHAPIPFKFVDKELIEKLRFDRLSTQYPDEALILKDVRTAQEQVQSALNSARAELHKSGLDIRTEDRVVEAAA